MKTSRLFTTAIAMLAVAVALGGCHDSRDEARGLVKNFLKANLKDQDFKVLDFSRLDSTTLVADSAVAAMRSVAAESAKFKNPIAYPDGQKTHKLRFIRVKYKTGSDTVRQTFYLDDGITRVVSFKTD